MSRITSIHLERRCYPFRLPPPRVTGWVTKITSTFQSTAYKRVTLSRRRLNPLLVVPLTSLNEKAGLWVTLWPIGLRPKHSYSLQFIWSSRNQMNATQFARKSRDSAPRELDVHSAPQKLTSGQAWGASEEQTKRIYSHIPSNRILRTIDLPAEVDVEKAKATLKDGILRVELLKASPTKRVPIETKAARFCRT